VSCSTDAGRVAKEPNADSIAADVARQLAQLRSLRNMDRAAVRLVASGGRAIPALRALLFERVPSGIFEPRCLAVWALAHLHAYEVLVEFLANSRETKDPVERIGEEAVINAAARGLRGVENEQVFQVLFAVAKRRLLPGVIDTLGRFRRPETIPLLIAALTDDDARPTAASALLKLGDQARPNLLCASKLVDASTDGENASHRQCRRTALELLREMGVARDDWPHLQPLMFDADLRIAMLACDIGLGLGMARDEAIRRLVGMSSTTDALLSLQLEDSLVRHDASPRGVVNLLVGRHNPLTHESGEE
jgi:HEAT repeat protein